MLSFGERHFLLRRRPVRRTALLKWPPFFSRTLKERNHEDSFILVVLHKAAVGRAAWSSPNELSPGIELALALLETKAVYAEACELLRDTSLEHRILSHLGQLDHFPASTLKLFFIEIFNIKECVIGLFNGEDQFVQF